MHTTSLLSTIALTLFVGSATPAAISPTEISSPYKTILPGPKPTFQSCGGHTATPHYCPKGYICVDNPYVGGCGMACDMAGICVKPTFCGGFAGLPCKGKDGKPDGRKCIDDPRDDCDPYNGGADCGGICV